LLSSIIFAGETLAGVSRKSSAASDSSRDDEEVEDTLASASILGLGE
jgi:hypothetical protein